MIYTLENDSLKVQVNSHGGELWSIQTKDGAEYLWQGDETYWKDRALNLFPYIARLTEGKYMLDGKTYETLPETRKRCLSPYHTHPVPATYKTEIYR